MSLLPPGGQPPLILASTSRYRRELLERLRVPFSVESPGTDETPEPGESPSGTARRLATLKARAVASRHATGVVIGSDQVAEIDGEVLDKPGNHARAVAQLRRVSGQSASFHTALAVLNVQTGLELVDEVRVVVRFRELSEDAIARYLDVDRPYDCAGSAKIESLGIALVERVDAYDPTALIGLPLIPLVSMLARAGIDVMRPCRPAPST